MKNLLFGLRMNLKLWLRLLFLFLAIIFTIISACSTPIKGVGKATGRLSGLKPADSLSSEFLEGYNAFTSDLLTTLYAKDKNTFLSPAGLYIALGMTSNGADGNTLTQMLDAMGIPDAETLNKGCRDLQSLLSGNPKKYFRISNAIWLKDSYKNIIKQDFISKNEEYYGALLAARPFDDSLIPAINKWAEKNSDGMIKQVLAPPLDPDVFMYLTNALLFDGKWEMKFKKGDTKDGVFHGSKGDITIPMMHRKDKEKGYWYEDDTVQATLLDYQDKRTAMLIALPKDNLDSLMAEMTPDTIPGWLDKIGDCGGMSITLPRFSLTYKQEMTDTLRSLGITDAFDETAADFGRMVDSNQLKGPIIISKVTHQTALEVDESGTRAAAVSLFSFANKSAAGYSMVVDRPFLCAIVDKPTGAVLFAGTISDPKKLD
jgi:serine protease inhibitor